MMPIRVILLLFGMAAALQGQAQYLQSFGIPHADSVILDQPVNRARRATLWSTFVPGAGQIYNGKFWKAGVVYAGAFGLGYMYLSNTDSMQAYQDAYIARMDTSAATVDTRYPYLTDASVKSFRDYHRRLRDISILGFVGLYALQIIDANVDAHLYEFKVNQDLSLRAQPEIFPNASGPDRFGFRLRLQF